MLPPMMHILSDIAGVDMPSFLGTIQKGSNGDHVGAVAADANVDGSKPVISSVTPSVTPSVTTNS